MPNKIYVPIEDCINCPCAKLKYDTGSEGKIMYCQQKTMLMMLREGWGSRAIPNWCPILEKQKWRMPRSMKNEI